MGTPYSETNDSGGGGELSSLVATLQSQQNELQTDVASALATMQASIDAYTTSIATNTSTITSQESTLTSQASTLTSQATTLTSHATTLASHQSGIQALATKPSFSDLEQSGKVHKIHYIPWSSSDVIQIAKPSTSYVTSVNKDNAFLKRAGTRLMIQIVVPFSISGYGGDTYSARLYTTISETIYSTNTRDYHYGPERQLIYAGQGGGGHRSSGLSEIATMTPSSSNWINDGAVQLQLHMKHTQAQTDQITILAGHFLVTEIFV